MEETIIQSTVIKGGEFVIKESKATDTFIPEELNEDQLMIKETIQDFLDTRIEPNYAKIEKQENNIAKQFLQETGDLGILGAHIPEAYGGMLLSTNTNTAIAEMIGKAGSFSVTYAAHTGIGMLPILYYGTEMQKQKYLPGLVSGELAAAYCLTEPGSGSDALAAKSKAILSEDGSYYSITGQKMWITNSGFADVFIVFAQVDGDKFTGFVIERGTEGLSLGTEEDKLGIKGSSTRQVFFENCKVPVENVLGKVGKGHLIAFNVLNIGRFKLGALALGAAKRNAVRAIQYANDRHQFNVPISSFGAIQHKIAEQAIRMYSTEAAVYRVSNMMQLKIQALVANGVAHEQAKLQAAEEYSVECALLKVYGSESLDYVVDETVQIHGGNGFSEEFAAAREYRDSRINRIFEGTNEINRLLMVNMLLRKAMKGQLDIVGPAWAVQKELAGMAKKVQTEGTFGEEEATLKALKKILLMVAGAGAKAQMDKVLDLRNEQEIVMNIADIMMDVFVLESTLLRVQRLELLDKDTSIATEILKTLTTDVVARVQKNANDALMSFAEGDVLRVLMMGVKRYAKYAPFNIKTSRRKIATYLIDANDYIL